MRNLARVKNRRFDFKVSTLETTKGQIDIFFSQLSFECCLPEVASAGD